MERGDLVEIFGKLGGQPFAYAKGIITDRDMAFIGTQDAHVYRVNVVWVDPAWPGTVGMRLGDAGYISGANLKEVK